MRSMRARSTRRRLPGAAAVALICSFGITSSPVRAEVGDAATAEALFQEGRVLMASKQFASACPKLEDSYRLDPATGTLLAMALCHERIGRIATAWKEYAVVTSRSDANSERLGAAREKVRQLGAAASRLQVVPSERNAQTPGFKVLCDGTALGPTKWGMALPVDGGTHVLEASVNGKKLWRLAVAVQPSGDSQTVHIPPLAVGNTSEDAESPLLSETDSTPSTPIAAASTASSAGSATPPPAEPPKAPPASAESVPLRSNSTADQGARSSGLSTWQIAGIGAMVSGLVGVGIGVGFTVRAVQKNNDSRNGCVGDSCDLAGMQARQEARRAGDNATVAIAAGAGLASAGAVAFLFGRRWQTQATVGAGSGRVVVDAVGPSPVGLQGFGGFVQGRF